MFLVGVGVGTMLKGFSAFPGEGGGGVEKKTQKIRTPIVVFNEILLFYYYHIAGCPIRGKWTGQILWGIHGRGPSTDREQRILFFN